MKKQNSITKEAMDVVTLLLTVGKQQEIDEFMQPILVQDLYQKLTLLWKDEAYQNILNCIVASPKGYYTYASALRLLQATGNIAILNQEQNQYVYQTVPANIHREYTKEDIELFLKMAIDYGNINLDIPHTKRKKI